MSAAKKKQAAQTVPNPVSGGVDWAAEVDSYEKLDLHHVPHFTDSAARAASVQRYNRALEQLSGGNWDIATIGIRRLAAEQPVFVSAGLLDAVLQMTLGNVNQAIATLSALQETAKLNQAENERVLRYLSAARATPLRSEDHESIPYSLPRGKSVLIGAQSGERLKLASAAERREMLAEAGLADSHQDKKRLDKALGITRAEQALKDQDALHQRATIEINWNAEKKSPAGQNPELQLDPARKKNGRRQLNKTVISSVIAALLITALVITLVVLLV